MNLATRYLGLELAHPFIPGASPLADSLDQVRRLDDAGAPAITLRSLFEEQIVGEQLATYHAAETLAHAWGEATSFLAEPEAAVFGPHEYLEHVRRVREAVDVPVIASLNGATRGGGLRYAALIAEAGAHALELNVYDLATDPGRTGAEIERETLEMVRELKRSIPIPVAVKLSPFYTSMANMARNLEHAGADGLVIFNRFYQPDIDIENLETVPLLRLSDSSELLQRLRWLAILRGPLRLDLAVTGGVHTVEDAIKALMCGATAIQVVSALLKLDANHLAHLRDGVRTWLSEHGYDSIGELRGSMSLDRCPDPRAFERANYMHILQSWRPD